MRPREIPLLSALLVALCLLGASCAPDTPTSSDRHAPEAPSLDGTGWVGGGGRAPADSTSTPPDSTARK